MDTFVSMTWIGFVVHSLGWIRLKRRRAIDAAGFLPLIFFYGRVSDMAHSRIRPWEMIGAAAISYGLYLIGTFYAWQTFRSTVETHSDDSGDAVE